MTREGGKHGDAGTKQDEPREQEGKGAIPAKEALETQRAAQERSQERAAEAAQAPAPKEPRKKAAPEAEGTAAAETGVDKDAAEAATKPARRRKDDEAAAPAEPKAQPQRRARRTDDETRPVVRAQAKYVRTSARKARLVCDHIRGKSVEEARAILAMTPRAVASDWSKLLESAVANAENNHELVGDDLRILSVHADEGPTLKRFRPRAMGRATRIRKRTSHLTIMLTPKE